MKNRILAFVILAVMIISLYGEDRIKEFKVDYFYIENSYENTEHYDFNGDLCSWIKVDYDIDLEIVFSDAGIMKKVVYPEKKEIDVFIEQWAKSVTISAEGFMPFKYRFPENLQPGKCYVMGIRAPEWLNKGRVLVSPNPPDARVSLISEAGLRYENIGISKFEELEDGYYQIIVEHEGCLTYEDNFSLEKGQEISLSPVLIDTNLYFELNIEPLILENLKIEVNKSQDFNTLDKVKIHLLNNRIAIGEAGQYYFRLTKDGRVLYSDKVSIFKDNASKVTLNYQMYSLDSKEGALYIDDKLYDMGEKLILITSHNKEDVRISIPHFRKFEFTEAFNDQDHLRNLVEGEDYFSSGFGIGLISNESKIFYGIKLPLLISADYYSMNGIELNIFNAGNKGKNENSGYFNGIGMAGLFMNTGQDMNGIAVSGLLTSAGGNLSGIAIGGVMTTVGRNMNGFSYGTINIVQGKATGLQLGVVNLAKDLKGVQIGLINIIDDGKGGGIPVMPLINMKF